MDLKHGKSHKKSKEVDDARDKYTQRQMSSHKSKQQAQERLFRLQTNLKHASSNRVDKGKHMNIEVSSKKSSNTNTNRTSSKSPPRFSSTTATSYSPANANWNSCSSSHRLASTTFANISPTKTHRNSKSTRSSSPFRSSSTTAPSYLPAPQSSCGSSKRSASTTVASHSATKTNQNSNSVSRSSPLRSSPRTTSGHSSTKTHRSSNHNRSRTRSPIRKISTASGFSPVKTQRNFIESLKQTKSSPETLRSFCFNERPKLVQPALAIFSPPKNKATQETSFSGRGNARGSDIEYASGVRNTWAKPKALLDASNRLDSTRSIGANQRLALLCESLQQRQMDYNNNHHGIEAPSPSKILPAFDAPFNSNPKPNCVQSMDDVESMDVEPMDVDSEEDIIATFNNTSVDANTNSFANKSTHGYVSLNRLFAVGKKMSARCLDHMYFVLDTNVLIHNMAFVEDVCQVALNGTKGSILFIPYIVIKELDNLNNRRNDKHLNHDAAKRAIRYLNKKFDNSLNIQAQSALEEADHLVEVDCADDSIVNCCLQLRSQVPHLTLLTNDNNLRLKAIASDIEVSCRSDLINTYREQFDALSQ